MKKFFGIIFSALAFGLIAGAVMIGVNKFYNDYQNKDIIYSEAKNEVFDSSKATKSNATNSSKSINTNQPIYKAVAASEDVSALVSDVMPSVVAITNMQKFTQNGYSMFGFRSQPQTYEAPASGSGFIFNISDDEVIIVTNNHVVKDSSSLSVTFLDSETVDAKIKGTDSVKDLAIIAVANKDIKMDIFKKIKSARTGDSDKIKIGEPVVAIGNALGYGQTVSKGILSAKDREIGDMSERLLQTDATINPGNSGGPLFNLQGEVIGINVAKSSGEAVEGMGYSIPIKTALDVIEKLSTKKIRQAVPENEQGYLGIMSKNIDATTAESLDMPEGVYVYKITEGSAASKSNLREKDIIIAFDDQSVKTYSDLADLISYSKAGEVIKLKVMRLEGGTYVEKIISVELGNKPVDEQKSTQKSKGSNIKDRSEAERQVPQEEQQPNQGNEYGNRQYYEIDPFGGFPNDFFDDWFRGFRGW